MSGEGYYEKVENFDINSRYYLETPFGQIKMFIENGKVNLQFWTRKLNK